MTVSRATWVRVFTLIVLIGSPAAAAWAHARCVEEAHTCKSSGPALECCCYAAPRVEPATAGPAAASAPAPDRALAAPVPIFVLDIAAECAAQPSVSGRCAACVDRVILFRSLLI